VNLATLQSFFSKESLGDLNGDTHLSQPLPVTLPDFQHYRHEFQNFLSVDRKTSHDLRKFVNRIKNDTLIYADLSDIILHNSDLWRSHDFDLFTPESFTPTFWALWSAFLASYASLGITLYICYRQKSPGSLLPILATKTAANNIPPILTYGNFPPTVSTISDVSLHPPVATVEGTIVIDLVTVSVLSLLVFVLLVFWIHRIQRRKNEVHIVLEINDYTDCVRIRCLSLKSVLYAYRFLASNYIESIMTSGSYPCYLLIH